VVPTVSVIVKNTVSANSGGLLISDTGTYNGINSPGDFYVIGFGPTIDTGVLTLTTHANGYCGIKIDNITIKFQAPLSCWYYTLPTVPPLNVYDIGYNWEIAVTFYNATNAKHFDQNGNNLTIYGTSSGVYNDNIVCVGTNRAYLQGTIGNQIDITGTQATIGGSSVPKITTQPLGASNTNEMATTQWSKTKLSGYATLNLNNTFNGSNNFTKSVEFKDVVPTPPVIVKNTVSANSGGLLISGTGSYNGINNPGDFAVIGVGPTADTGVLNLTTFANGYRGIKIDNATIKYNAPFS
jgi:hypothetical protein